MQRRNTFLATSALLLTAACTFNPKVDPNKLDCKDDNGCPSGYRCVDATDAHPGFCCNSADASACVRSPPSPTADATSAAGDARTTEASSDAIGRADGSGGQDAIGASDVSAERQAADANTTDRAEPQAPDSNAAADLAGVQTDGAPNFDAGQPDAASPVLDAPVLPDTLVSQDALALTDNAAVQDAPPDVPVSSHPDAALDLSSDTPVASGPKITSIEGTATASAVSPRTEDIGVWTEHANDRIPASHRISSANPELVVTGTGLDGVTQATLKGQSSQGDYVMTIEENTMTNLRLRWPSTLAAGGLFILSLTAVAGTAEAQVFFLQGEKGDPAVSEPGNVVMSAASSLPTGWLLCDGSAVSRTTYAALFAAIGTTYGTGDGSTTFNLPNMTDKFPRGNTLGIGGGADAHSHTAGTLAGPNHTHTVPKDGWGANLSAPFSQGTLASSYDVADRFSAVRVNNDNTSGEAGTGAVTGSTDMCSNVPVYTGLKFIIKT